MKIYPRMFSRNLIASVLLVAMVLSVNTNANAITLTEYNEVSKATYNIIGGAVFTRDLFDVVTRIESLQVTHDIMNESVIESVIVYYDIEFRFNTYDYLYAQNDPFFMGEQDTAREASVSIMDALGSAESVLYDGYDYFTVPYGVVKDFLFAHNDMVQGYIDSQIAINDDIIGECIDTLTIIMSTYAKFTLLERDELINRNVIEVKTTIDPVPEPATMLLFGTGLVGLAGYRRKQANKKQ